MRRITSPLIVSHALGQAAGRKGKARFRPLVGGGLLHAPAQTIIRAFDTSLLPSAGKSSRLLGKVRFFTF
jgi:hypothetical protein